MNDGFILSLLFTRMNYGCFYILCDMNEETSNSNIVIRKELKSSPSLIGLPHYR